jgi:hypothetical protein
MRTERFGVVQVIIQIVITEFSFHGSQLIQPFRWCRRNLHTTFSMLLIGFATLEQHQ